jgi:RNA polymerase sigma factor (sigma-70 family)
MTTTAVQAPVSELVAAAARGDEGAWSRLITRYSPLVVTVINRFGLGRADAADVNQTVWLRLVEHLDRLREPEALPMWIVQTTRHECLRLLRVSRQTRLIDPLDEYLVGVAGPADVEAVDEQLLQAERRQVLRDAYAELPSRCQQMLAMMLQEPPASYEEIGERMGIPVGSVGPTRGRCMHKLRNCPALVAFARAVREAETDRGEAHRDTTIVGR